MRANPTAAFDSGYALAADGCWIWTKATTASGYGVLRVFGRQMRAHRYAFERFVGPILPGAFVCHSCDNPSCVNPSHLFLGQPMDNTRDMISKGRQYKKVTTAQVLAIRADTRPDPIIAAEYGISKSQVCCIQRRRRWLHV